MFRNPRLHLVVSAFAISTVAACASAPSIPPDSQPLTLSIQGLVCLDCGKELEALSLKVPGVRQAHFDDKRVEVQLEVAPGFSADPLIAAIQAQPIDGRGVTASLGAGAARMPHSFLCNPAKMLASSRPMARTCQI
jgi:hypothetical protein